MFLKIQLLGESHNLNSHKIMFTVIIALRTCKITSVYEKTIPISEGASSVILIRVKSCSKCR